MIHQRKKKTSLSSLKEGREAVVLSFTGEKINNQKLVELGIIPGSQITIVSGGKDNPYLVKVQNTRVMIGYDMAQTIIVKER